MDRDEGGVEQGEQAAADAVAFGEGAAGCVWKRWLWRSESLRLREHSASLSWLGTFWSCMLGKYFYSTFCHFPLIQNGYDPRR